MSIVNDILGNVINDKKEKVCTPKEESAIQFYVKYGNKSKSIRHGLDLVDVKPETVWEMASRVFKKPHVVARVEELRLELEGENLTTRRDQLEKLIKIRDYNMPGSDEERDVNIQPDQAHGLKAIALINQMLGWDAPIRIETKNEVTVDFRTSAEFKTALEAIQRKDDC